jgi:zinc/manganese transport system substrate-binding protein
MRPILRFVLLAWLGVACGAAHAALNIFATVPEWASLSQELGGDKVRVYLATSPLQDPHHVQAKPSLIARARTADLVVATGAELEVGWLPLVLQQAGNDKVQPGSPGYFAATRYVTLLGKPTRLDRAEGDVHPEGDPHIQGDPRNIGKVAAALEQRLGQLDPSNAAYYKARYDQFSARWNAAIAKWEHEAAPLKGVRIVVQHKGFTYLEAWLGLKEVAALEPKPGMEPTTSHLAEVLSLLRAEPAKMVLLAAYQSDRASQWLAQRSKIHVVKLPFTVGGTDEAKDLFSFYDDTIRRLLEGNS